MQTSERLCAPRAEKYRNSRAGSVLPFSLKAPASAKPGVGWRFAPACCAAQSVRQARRRSAVQGSAPARYPGTSGVQNKFFVPWHRAGGAMQFGQRCPLPAQTHPKERQLRSSSLARQMASIFQPFQVEWLQSFSRFKSRQCWLTTRSTGPATAGVVSLLCCAYTTIAHQAYNTCRCGPVSSNVSHHSFN